jgi:hypothetical protein
MLSKIRRLPQRERRVQPFRCDSLGVSRTLGSSTSALKYESVLGGERISSGISVPVVLLPVRQPQRDVTAMEMFNQSECHIHASRYARRCPPVSILDPTSLGHPIDALGPVIGPT